MNQGRGKSWWFRFYFFQKLDGTRVIKEKPTLSLSEINQRNPMKKKGITRNRTTSYTTCPSRPPPPPLHGRGSGGQFPEAAEETVDWISCFVCLRSHGANESSKADGYIYMHFINAFFFPEERNNCPSFGSEPAASSVFQRRKYWSNKSVFVFREKVEFQDLKFWNLT